MIRAKIKRILVQHLAQKGGEGGIFSIHGILTYWNE